jgi:predicted Ser/Thr protein kinase
MALDGGELLAGRYRKLGTIGVGGMARVYLAEDVRLGRRVAVKRMHADGPEDAAVRFEREAKLGASLNHPGLVSVYDVETEAESVLIVMEYVDGETLQEAITRGPVDPERVVEIVRDVAAGLDHAHAHGVVHRDVKPANVLLRRDGMAKLADLGIATAAEQTSITRSGVVLGTAAYMAPEQLEGGRATPATDVYALAAVAFEALSGRKARTGRTPVEIAHEMVSRPPPDLAREWSGAPPGMAAALARGMAREPRDRPASAGALAAELERGLRDGGSRRPRDRTAATAALAAGAASPAGRPARRRASAWAPAALAALAVAVALAAVVAGLGGDGSDRDSVARPEARADGSGGAGGSSASAQDARQGDGGAGESDGGDEPVEATPPEPGDGPVELNDQGFALMQAGRYEEAIPLLEQAVGAYPEGSQELPYAYALYNLGRSLRLAGRADEAVPILERRLQIPNQTDTVRAELDAARREAG